MEINYKPKNKLEKFGVKVYSALVENFSQTFFVGGTVRDLLLSKNVTDIDIATSATPNQVILQLALAKINYDDSNKNFGSVVAKQGTGQVEITTLRKDLPSTGRYPKVTFINSPKIDSQRRDFTINSLYLSLNDNKILDFQDGIKDLQSKYVRFIGNPEKRIKEDPLRVIRALRIALILNFKLENKTRKSIINNFGLIKNLTKTKLEKEINKIKNQKDKNILRKVINNPKLLDKYFK